MGPVADAERKPAQGRLTEEDLMHALPVRSGNREVRVGIFVLIGIAAFLTVLFTMTDVGTFRGRYYATTVVESAGGMRRGDPVQMRGVNIGRVIQFRMVPEGVAVRLEIYNEYTIPRDSRAELRSSGLLGGMTVDIIPGSSPERIASGAVIPGTSGAGIFDTAEDLGLRADTALARVNMLLSERNIGAIGASTGELQALLQELNTIASQQRAELAGLTASLRRSAQGVEVATTGPELQRSVQQIDALTAQLDQATRNLNQTSESLQTVVGRMERGEGTLGRLTADESLYTELEATVTNLNATVDNVNALVTDIQANPRRYINISVFGR
jgi:phospholipid/cholesterol/gamma-HCH transport system substrate-binding protein